MPEDLFQIVFVKTRHNFEHALLIKTAVYTQNVQVGIKSKKITKRLYGDNSAWHCFLFRYGYLKKDL